MITNTVFTKVFIKLVRISIIVLTVYYLSMFTIVKYVDVSRNNRINEQLDNNVSTIKVNANPTHLIWRYNPTDYFQLEDFKKYYNIPDNCKIEVKHFGIFEKVEKRIKN